MRYIPHTEADVTAMLASIGLSSVDELVRHVPADLRRQAGLAIADGLGEAEAVLMTKRLAPKAGRVLLAASLHPEYRQVVRTYLEGLPGLECQEIPFGADGRLDAAALKRSLAPAPAGVVVGYPNVFGVVED